MMLLNTLIGKLTARFAVSSSMRMRAVWYSASVRPVLNTISRWNVRYRPHASATSPMTENTIRNRPLSRAILSSAFSLR